MPRTFNGTSDHLDASVGGWNSITGDCTVAILGFHTGRTLGPIFFMGGTGASIFAFGIATDGSTIDTPDWFVNTTDSLATDLCATTGWYLIAGSKAAGTNAPRLHVSRLGTGTWTHVAAGTNQPNKGASSTSLSFGRADASTTFGAGDFAVVGAWTANLSDQQVESLITGLDAWFHPNLVALHLFDQAATTTAVPDVSGQGANQSSVTGTSVSTRSLPLFSWDASEPIWIRTQASTATNAPAGNAAGIGAASQPTVSVAVGAGVATGSGAAGVPTAKVSPSAGNAAGTGQAFQPGLTLASSPGAGSASGTGLAGAPTVNVQPSAGRAAGTGAAAAPSIAVAVNGGEATGTGAAYQPTVSAGSNTNAPAGNAAGTGAAAAPTASIKPNTSASTGAGAAYQPTVLSGAIANPGNAAGTGAASAPTASIKPNAGNAAGTGQAFQPVATPAKFASAGNAAGTGAAAQPTIRIFIGAGVAAGTGAAYQPTVSGPAGSLNLKGVVTTVTVSAAGASESITFADSVEGVTTATGVELVQP